MRHFDMKLADLVLIILELIAESDYHLRVAEALLFILYLSPIL